MAGIVGYDKSEGLLFQSRLNTKNKLMKYFLAALLIGIGAAFAQPSANDILFQSERYYSVRIPEHLVNSYLMIQNGRLDQVSAQDYNELNRMNTEQIAMQYRQYAQQDSVLRAAQKPETDTSKTKRP